TRWEATTGSPLPLGGIIARRTLGDEVIGRVQAVIGDSIEYAIADRDAALPTMRRHAQEFDDDVLMQHVDLYVNQWTRDLGDAGVAALKRLTQEARKVGIVGPANELKVF
ncbi:MAG TPA: hypothetical protein DDZ51_12545, partial [Planctomycetaceae bacterium]|nr:hypothetical protein [Planctomycetaceae bacterium]